MVVSLIQSAFSTSSQPCPQAILLFLNVETETEHYNESDSHPYLVKKKKDHGHPQDVF